MKKLILSLFIVLSSLPAFAEGKESAFDRIMRTGVIRCGYYVFPPATYRDPNTGELSGFTIDMMNEIAARADLKIEWAEETNFSNWIPGIKTGRFDVSCTPNWPEITQARAVAFSVPMFFAGLSPAVRADDPRFKTDDLSVFNSEDITFAAQDGEAAIPIIKSYFPKANLKLLPPDGDISNFALEVLTGKADVFLTDANGEVEFGKTNENKIRLVAKDKPLKYQSFTLAVNRDELILKDYLDNAILELIYDGTMDHLLRKWESKPGEIFMRVVNPAQ
ncbi:MAG: amino acid ABC transporter substrate-binding protein [Alphaproteobacteria bacterium]|nr:amino acid ABC transporter substrate-binding protein [Alphaproteobacteria bacterium]